MARRVRSHRLSNDDDEAFAGKGCVPASEKLRGLEDFGVVDVVDVVDVGIADGKVEDVVDATE